MDKIIIRPMTPEDWGAVSRIYVEGIATEYATFQTECPPYTAWDASHTKECKPLDPESKAAYEDILAHSGQNEG